MHVVFPTTLGIGFNTPLVWSSMAYLVSEIPGNKVKNNKNKCKVDNKNIKIAYKTNNSLGKFIKNNKDSTFKLNKINVI